MLYPWSIGRLSNWKSFHARSELQVGNIFRMGLYKRKVFLLNYIGDPHSSWDVWQSFILAKQIWWLFGGLDADFSP